MFVLALLTCIVLRALSAQAKVVNSFTECKSNFFYKNKEPRMDQNAQIFQNTKKICQVYKDEQGYQNTYYATLYSVNHRIPLYSAYTFSAPETSCSTDGGKMKDWYIEPQISNDPTEHMVLEKDTSASKNDIKIQAMNSDYIYSGYDRGHLYPNSFQCNCGRKATFTLTNAAPMDPCFNRVHWSKWERSLKIFLTEQLKMYSSAKAYVVTGTVPDASTKIPQRVETVDQERVTVPSHIWTAVCFEHQSDNDDDDKARSLSFGFMGKNKPESEINLMSVSALNDKLKPLYRMQGDIKIFDDNCFGDNNKLNKVQEQFNLINHKENLGVQMSSDVQNTFDGVKRIAGRDSQSSGKKLKVTEMTVKLAFENMNNYFAVAEDLKVFSGSACLLTHAKPLEGTFVHDELRKREVSEGTDAVECQLFPEKRMTAADGSPCSSVTDSSDSCKCDTRGEIKPCCSSPCLYNEKLNSYRCYSGQKLIECSPRYSLITANGEKCMDCHPCATYGHDYYWCWTSMSLDYFGHCQWDYCSPPPLQSVTLSGKNCRSNHACGKNGKSYLWCYTDDKNNWDYCTTSDDCHSAKKGKTCKSDHRCDYHGEKYLWCETTDGSWDYCFRACGKQIV